MRNPMAEAAAGEKLKVFVSYSRRDSSDFVEELVAGLELAGFAPFLDRHDIAAGEDWEARLGGLIQEADTVVFVISPEALKSERCAWEANTALAKTKRLLPVIFRSVPETDIPEQLRRRQFVRFDTAPGITRPLAQLAQALRQDIDWIREHTRLGELANRWEMRNRQESLLLRGDDLAAAQSWIGKRNAGAPAITDLIRTFIASSKEAEATHFAKSNAAQRHLIRMQALICALLFGVVVGLFGWINQSFIREQWRWHATVRPFVLANISPYVLTASAARALKPKDSFRECATASRNDYCPEMVVVAAGSFMMGTNLTENGHQPKEEPQHSVTIAEPFAVSKFEVTFAEWDACAAYGDCDPHIGDSGFGHGQQPVINVTWDDAKHYVDWLSQMTGKPYRLLSEAEYEYAARAGTQTAYPWGDDIGKGNANCDGCSSQWDNKEPAPVGSFAANKFGLYDMLGNVWEWVEDCWHSNYAGAPADGSPWIDGGNCAFRVDRAGSWGDRPDTLRSAGRDKDATGARDAIIGFRVARTLEHW
jgi:formylglycine-generating enzyme required for sulfatase activity